MRSLTQQYEDCIRAAGFSIVAGVDEVGRGAWAGPIVAAGVIFEPETKIKGLNDSKKLTHLQRLELAEEIKSKAVKFSVQLLDVDVIDVIGVGKANEEVIKRVVAELNPQYALIDKAWVYNLATPHDLIVGGDGKVFSIGAASIIAKVFRDQIMVDLDITYPGYGFADHKGYGTKEHQSALERLGVCVVHRKSFQPIMQARLI